MYATYMMYFNYKRSITVLLSYSTSLEPTLVSLYFASAFQKSFKVFFSLSVQSLYLVPMSHSRTKTASNSRDELVLSLYVTEP